MMALVTDWLVATLVYTGALITAVLLLRRPVARHFGPQVGYALWALPLLRFVLPPLVLPAWMAPARESVAAAGEPVLVLVADTSAAADAASTIATAPSVMPALNELLLPLWLAGAALFLLWRARNYLVMRRHLLADARPVGEAGKVRLVETPAVSSPVAFGVRDKVVALPPSFMVRGDRAARDLAIAHELAHHRGRDLLANIVAQPLLALHWFNPVAWLGWRAMRRDQEAACDARVVAGRTRTERALYASVIAGFAGGGRQLALAAPMACPMLGEKSIIHRLKSLSHSEVPVKRRRLGQVAIGAAALGLPLTASISYAAPQPPAAPAALAPPAAPVPPEAPPPPEPIAPDVAAPAEQQSEAHHHTAYHIVRQDGSERSREGRAQALEEARFERDLKAELEAGRAEREQALAEMRQALAERDRALDEARRDREEALRETRIALRDVPQVSSREDCAGDQTVAEHKLADGRKAIVVCTSGAYAQAVEGLREARSEIESSDDIPAAQRKQILRQLDEQIEQMSSAGHVAVSLRYDAWPAVVSSAVAYSSAASAAAADGDEVCAAAQMV